MSYGDHTVTLRLHEVSTERLQRERDRCMELAQKCNAQGTPWHTWDTRRHAIEGVLEARRRAPKQRVPDDVPSSRNEVET